MLKTGQTCSVNTPKFLKYLRTFFNIIHESVIHKFFCWSLQGPNCLNCNKFSKVFFVDPFIINEDFTYPCGTRKDSIELDKVFINLLTLPAPSISEKCIKIKIDINFYFHTSLRCLKRFYEDLKDLHKTFWGTTKKYKNKNLNWFFLFVWHWDRN